MGPMNPIGILLQIGKLTSPVAIQLPKFAKGKLKILNSHRHNYKQNIHAFCLQQTMAHFHL